MLIAKIITCILSLFFLILARLIYDRNDYKRSVSSNTLTIVASVFGITFCIFHVITWNVFTIMWIFIYISALLYILFKDFDEACLPFRVSAIISFISFIICCLIYVTNIVTCDSPDVKTTTYTIICAKDGTALSGNISGTIYYVQGSNHQDSIYKCYYELENGGIQLATLPAESTTIYFVDLNNKSYFEVVETTKYSLNTNYTPPTRCFETTQKTYNLYIPQGSITNVYEFDAN